jgi:hypothetical protein
VSPIQEIIAQSETNPEVLNAFMYNEAQVFRTKVISTYTFLYRLISLLKCKLTRLFGSKRVIFSKEPSSADMPSKSICTNLYWVIPCINHVDNKLYFDEATDGKLYWRFNGNIVADDL